MMKKVILLLLLLILMLSVSACDASVTVPEDTEIQEKETEEKQVIYENITADEAKQIMDAETGYVILDVRTEEEYAEGHIPGAILIPDYEIAQKSGVDPSRQGSKDPRLLPKWTKK